MPELPQTCTELLARMVGFNTVVAYHSGIEEAERKLAEYLAEIARAWGFAVRELPIEGACHNLLIEHRVVDDAPWLVFDAHMDTVGVEGMTIDPFAATIREGRLYGRGSCDTKGTGAAMLWALREYAKSNDQPNNIALLCSVGEEHVQTGARAFVAEHLAMLDWRPAGVVVGEPTQMDVLAATGGFVRWKMTTYGKACHSSKPDQGHNAIYDMAYLIIAIEQDYIRKITSTHPLVGRGSAAITVIKGGKQVNVIPADATITFDRRLMPGEEGAVEMQKVMAIAEAVAASRPGMRVEHHQFESAPPMATVDDGRFAERAAMAIRSTGVSSRITGEPFTTNGNHFAAAGIPTIVTGPGDIAQAHLPDEWIALDELDRGVAGYLAIMQS
ncbi:M20 family metallopeptidase [Aeoliella sp. SH292]|uniref:M20 family metallopeptidase n=1 Tax=Aeoliella sp. SH292 TaxID=3454464 RepID=UPI003F9EAD8F